MENQWNELNEVNWSVSKQIMKPEQVPEQSDTLKPPEPNQVITTVTEAEIC
jgi:hypothetical protein